MDPVSLGATCFGVGVFIGMMATLLAGSDPRIARLERKLNAVLEHLGVDLTTGLTQELRNLIAEGRKIEAVKLYRDQTGCDLRTAKDYVESL
jgi:hypothetical protein